MDEEIVGDFIEAIEEILDRKLSDIETNIILNVISNN